MAEKKHVILSVDPDVYERLVQIASARGMAVSDYVAEKVQLEKIAQANDNVYRELHDSAARQGAREHLKEVYGDKITPLMTWKHGGWKLSKRKGGVVITWRTVPIDPAEQVQPVPCSQYRPAACLQHGDHAGEYLLLMTRGNSGPRQLEHHYYPTLKTLKRAVNSQFKRYGYRPPYKVKKRGRATAAAQVAAGSGSPNPGNPPGTGSP